MSRKVSETQRREQINWIQDQEAAGRSMADIAAELGCSREWIRRLLRGQPITRKCARAGCDETVTTRTKRYCSDQCYIRQRQHDDRNRPEDMERRRVRLEALEERDRGIVDLMRKGHTKVSVARTFNISVTTVGQIVKRREMEEDVDAEGGGYF